MSKPNQREWKIKHLGYEIKVTSWFNWSGKMGGELLIDGHLLDKLEIDQVDDDNFNSIFELFNPEKPILKALGISEQTQKLEVFSGGALTRKISIMCNGENIYQDHLGLIDKLAIRLMKKLYEEK
tara:strand:+ start:374 stop:748 length:375 start_codon:yes stop_codon:yes gene_type:complete